LIGLVMAPILGSGSHTINENKAACCMTTPACTSMSKEECIAKGCTNATCEYMMQEVSKQITIEKSIENGVVTASITTNVNGKVERQVFEGTDAEVQAKIDELK
jgi:K(+)-stimulated pyrophosphate-energized sodium pump